MDAIKTHAAKHWNRLKHAIDQRPRRWWESLAVRSHINKLIDGSEATDFPGSFHRLIERENSGRKYQRGLSVACGAGVKELKLVKAGIVERFDLYEISDARIKVGKERAAKAGALDQMTFHCSDAFDNCKHSDYDLVYWDSGLHHMLDVNSAVIWSIARLRAGGVFAMSEYTGPSRLQFDDFVLNAATEWRRSLDPRFLLDPDREGSSLPVEIRRPTVENMIRMDPTESADSGNIMPAILRHLPHANIRPYGGAIYQVAMANVFANMHLVEDAGEIQRALDLDYRLMMMGFNHHTVAIATV